MKKMLIAYYSWSNGNTESIARQLQRASGADMVKIETVQPYPADYDETVSQAQREVNAGFMPEIKEMNVSIADYDVIAIGTPAWWYTMAPAVATFIDQNDWQDKTVVPFMTDAGWPGSVIDDISSACRGAKTACPFEARFDSNGGSKLSTPQRATDAWCERVAKLLA